jgi:Domain of unknown function (DUF4166)
MIELVATPPDAAAAVDYRQLVGAAAWSSLPAATRARFASHAAEYSGSMTLHASRCGRCVAALCRVVGSPLPPASDVPLASTVRVEPDRATGGARWLRRYEFPHGPVEISSVKALDASGSLVERLPMGLRMKLDVFARDSALHFVSAGYYFEWLGLRLPLPSWWLPGRTHVTHRDLGGGRFRFTMTVRHAWLGKLFDHDGVFTDGGHER